MKSQLLSFYIVFLSFTSAFTFPILLRLYLAFIDCCLCFFSWKQWDICKNVFINKSTLRNVSEEEFWLKQKGRVIWNYSLTIKKQITLRIQSFFLKEKCYNCLFLYQFLTAYNISFLHLNDWRISIALTAVKR